MRDIGIRHRVKRTAKGEARPTQVAILAEDEKLQVLDLKTEEDELEFVFNLRANDTVAMALGGSGDNLAFALSHQAEKIGACVVRIPPFLLKEKRTRDKDEDAMTLADLVRLNPELFYLVTPRDRQLILIRENLQARTDAMKARIACEQRLRQRLIGEIFRREDGLFPEGAIEDLFDERKANDTVLQSLIQEEKAREKELVGSLEKLDVYAELFKPIEGCGPMIAARIISAVIDIRRFQSTAKLKAFCSVHVLSDGRFARRRQGEIANWHPDARQALYLLGDQFNRRPNSVWGRKLLEYKKKFRETHPAVECTACKVPIDQCVYIVPDDSLLDDWEEIKSRYPNLKREFLPQKFHKRRYTDGHILKMALWRTRTRFAEWLFSEWWKLEREHQHNAKAA